MTPYKIVSKLERHPLMMSELRGREGVQEIRTLVIRVSTQNLDMGEGGGPKIGRKFGHHLWIVPKPYLKAQYLRNSIPALLRYLL